MRFENLLGYIDVLTHYCYTTMKRIISFNGNVLKRVCYSCFTTLKKPRKRQLLLREIVERLNIITDNFFIVNNKDMLFWFQSLYRYVSKNI